jgi:hypothetical protein
LNKIPDHLFDKAGSNVFERFLEQKLDNFFEAFVKYLSENDHLKKAVCDSFGNYVVQTMIRNYSTDERLNPIITNLKQLSSELMGNDFGRKLLSNMSEYIGLPGFSNTRKSTNHSNNMKSGSGANNNKHKTKRPQQNNQAPPHHKDNSNFGGGRRNPNSNHGQNDLMHSQRSDNYTGFNKKSRGTPQMAHYGGHQNKGYDHYGNQPSRGGNAYAPNDHQQAYYHNEGGYAGYHQHNIPIYGPYGQPPSGFASVQSNGGFPVSIQTRGAPYNGYGMNVNLNVSLNYENKYQQGQYQGGGHQHGMMHHQNQQTQTMHHHKGASSTAIVQSATHSNYGQTYNAPNSLLDTKDYQSQSQDNRKHQKDGQPYVVLQQHGHYVFSQSQSGNNSPMLPPQGMGMHPKSQGNSATKVPKVNLNKMASKAAQPDGHANLLDAADK